MMVENAFFILLALMLAGALSLLAIPREKKRKDVARGEGVVLDQYADLVKLVMDGEVREALKRVRRYVEKETDTERRRLLKNVEAELRKHV
ncbi:hypothetical protein CSUB_C0350 [Candidatus Caldarchaeum subterraneum]|nr:hypothetical protein CSUB_C0350 [Candidatus Caldarchaeum subterraneum]